MKLEKNLEMSALFDMYSKVLTNKQALIFEEYYFNDMSLMEIGENYNISRQAVLDSLKKSQLALEKMEEDFGLLKKYNSLKNFQSILKNSNDKSLTEEFEKIIAMWEVL